MLFNYALTSLALSTVAYAMPVGRQVGGAPAPDPAGTLANAAGLPEQLQSLSVDQLIACIRSKIDPGSVPTGADIDSCLSGTNSNGGGSGRLPDNGVNAPVPVTRETKWNGSPPTLGKAGENSVDVPATRGANSNGSPKTLEEADESGVNVPGLVTGGTNSNDPSLIPRAADDDNCVTYTFLNGPPLTIALQVCNLPVSTPGSRTDGTNADPPVPASNAISVVSLQNRADPTGSDVADGTDTPLRAGVTSGSLAFEYPGSLADSPNPALPVRK